MSSSWFGESLANIKGQITSFTKEVLTAEDDEQEGGSSTAEIERLKLEIVSLTETCKQRDDEILQLRTRETELENKYKASELLNKTSQDLYQKLLKSSENGRNHTVEDQLAEAASQEQRHVQNQRNEGAGTQGENLQESNNLSTFEQGRIYIHKKDESTETETQTYDELFVRELEERCSSYQNDLYIIRNELMNVQREADQSEERNAKFNEDISLLFETEFILDGQSIFKSSHPHQQSNDALILTKIKEISFLWKDLIEKKCTLERTVTKLSAAHSNNSISTEVASVCQSSSSQSQVSSNSNIIDLFNEHFCPPKIDSFGLETILEEDRSEDEAHRCESTDIIYEQGYGGVADGQSSVCQHRPQGTPSPAHTKLFSNSSTQTEDELEEPTSDKEPPISSLLQIQANELSEFQARAEKWMRDEAELIVKLEERDGRIVRLELDLGRLRSHLVDLEEQTTGEALLSAKREEQLQIQLNQLKNELSRTLQQNDRSLDVREEIAKLSQERNSYRNANSSLEDQIQKLNAQLQNLHFVLEQFQREKETEVRGIEKRLGVEMRQLEQKNEVLGRELEKERNFLEKAKSGLEAAHQLNVQIEDKTKSILHLKAQVQDRENEVLQLKSRMAEVANTLDGKIDRYLIKNLVVGYFTTPEDKRSEVLRIIATVLDFNREDRQKTGLESGFSLWNIGRRSSGLTSEKEKQSLSQAFINFLENESNPKVELRMSIDEVTRNSRSSGSPSSGMSDSGGGGMGRESPVTGGSEGNSVNRIMPEISMSLPVLNQADRSNSILKDILNPKP